LKRCLRKFKIQNEKLKINEFHNFEFCFLNFNFGGERMAVKVRIPTPLQRLTQGKEEVEGITGTIMEMIADLDKKYPGIGERISEGGKIRRFVNVYVNEEDIRFLSAENTTVKDGDEVSIVPAIAGGRGEF
jgi:molybdopterin synthase sulfur carrier subunit